MNMRLPSSFPQRLALASGASLSLVAAAVMACAFLVPQLLDDRAGLLQATPANSFAYEMAHLVAPTDALRADEAAPDTVKAQQARDENGVAASQVGLVQAMRALPDGDAAYAAGAGLPEAVRLYTAAAQDYRATPNPAAAADAGKRQPSLRDRARTRFEAVLALPAAQAAPRAVWAAYMLAQWHAADIGAAGRDAARARARGQAVAWYERTRSLAIAGAPDPWALAVASYGEQARMFLMAGALQCDWVDFDTGRECADAVPLPDIKRAVALYAQQAARGSSMAVDSLRVIAAWALRDDERAGALIDDPVTRQLLVAYGLARLGDIQDGKPDSAYEYNTEGNTAGYNDSARGGPGMLPNPALVNLVSAMQRYGVTHIAGADRVAALAYRVGRYDLAQALAGQQTSALAAWVRAKLALRRGDLDAAARAYAEAAKAFPQMDVSVEPDQRRQLIGEQGVLQLSRAQYVEALEQFRLAALDAAAGRRWSSDVFPRYSDDAAYVAERVLTLDELKTYVDAHARASAMPTSEALAAALKDRPAQGPDEKRYAAQRLSPPTINDQLRQLLARRLVRAGRFDDALPYFPEDGDERFTGVTVSGTDEHPVFTTWQQRASAREYGAALEAGQHGWRATTRAQGWYRAAQLARWRGMEIMGYEQAPDYTVYGGMLAGDSGPAANLAADQPSSPQQRAQSALPGPFVSADERRRYAASEAQPNKRYHYRDIAADHIGHAADELPPRSQAFAAVLCQGASLVFYDDRAGELYRRYVKQGAFVPFAANFGRDCAEPDFSAASRFAWTQSWRQARSWVGQHRPASAAMLLVLALGAVGGVSTWVRRRRRAG